MNYCMHLNMLQLLLTTVDRLMQGGCCFYDKPVVIVAKCEKTKFSTKVRATWSADY